MNVTLYAATTASQLGPSLTVFAVAFGIIGFIGGAVGYFAKGRASAIIEGQAELLDVRDKQITDKDKQVVALTAERDSLKDANETLKSLTQGSPQLIKLGRQIDALPDKIAKSIVKSMKVKR
jgi:hypothetical protein